MRLATGLAAATLAAFTLTGCAGSDDTATSPAPATASATSATPDQTPDATRSAASAPAQPDGPTLQITLDGDQVAPNGQRLEVPVGEPLLLRFTTDRAGEASDPLSNGSNLFGTGDWAGKYWLSTHPPRSPRSRSWPSSPGMSWAPSPRTTARSGCCRHGSRPPDNSPSWPSWCSTRSPGSTCCSGSDRRRDPGPRGWGSVRPSTPGSCRRRRCVPAPRAARGRDRTRGQGRRRAGWYAGSARR